MLRFTARAIAPSRSSHLFMRTLSSRTPKVFDYEGIKKLVEHPDANKVLIDVREPSELESYKMPTSINIPLQSAPGALGLPKDEFKEIFQFPKPEADQELIFFCLKGIRAKAAEELARSYGYEDTGVYPGSINEWLQKGGADVTPK